jgi:hypothetical protein
MAAAAMLPHVNEMLNHTNPIAYANAKAAVQGAANVRAALEAVKAFAALPAAEAVKARAELDALAHSPVDQEIRDALKDAFDHSASANIAWVDASPVAVQVSVDAAGVRHIVIHAPFQMGLTI